MAGSPGAGVIYQDLATAPGQGYRLRFALAGNPVSNDPIVKAVEVHWGDTLVDTPTFDVTGRTQQDMGWKYVEYRLTARSDTTRLRFVSPINTDGGAVIDDISVTPIPEPAVFGSAVLACSAASLRRRGRDA